MLLSPRCPLDVACTLHTGRRPFGVTPRSGVAVPVATSGAPHNGQLWAINRRGAAGAMSEEQQTAEQRRRLGLPAGLAGLDPRKAVDPATMERLIRAQEHARAQAAAATTVVLGTVVTLIS